MEGILVNFRRGRGTMKNNQMLLQLPGVDSRGKATAFLYKGVVWTSPAKREIYGKVIGIHGVKGTMRVRFNRGMPGQAIGSKAKIVDHLAPKAAKPAAPKAAAKPAAPKAVVKPAAPVAPKAAPVAKPTQPVKAK